MTTLLILTNLVTAIAFIWKRDQWCVLVNENSEREWQKGR